MNEELKIIVKAVTDGAKKSLDGVKQELQGINEESGKASKAVGVSMKGIAKGVGIALAAFTALTGAMVALTKQSMEFQKAYNRLISGFQSSGSTISQATKTYKELFGFMGEADTATEASNLLVKLTNDEQNLAEWTQILKGVYATFPDSLPVEALAESANETARVGQVTGNLADALNWAGVSEDAFNAKLAQTNSLSEREALIRQTLNGLYGTAASIYDINNKKLIEYNLAQARLDIAMANATRNVTPMLTAMADLGATIVTVLTPAFETVSAVIIVFCQWIGNAISAIGSFFGVVGGVSNSTASYSEGLKQYYSDLDAYFDKVSTGAEETQKNIEKVQKQLMGFDELNVVSSPTPTGSTGGGGASAGGGGNMPKLSDYVNMDEMSGVDEFQAKIEETRKRLEVILTIVGLIGTGFLLWKASGAVGFVAEAFKIMRADGASILQTVKQLPKYMEGYYDTSKGDGAFSALLTKAGAFAAIAGALVAIVSYSDAWVNGLDWGNFATIIGGLAVMVGGLALAFGSVGAIIGLVVGSIAMVVLGVKDLITNGYNLKGAIMAIVGAAMLLGGAANPILGVITLIVGGIYILWNECEGFRNFWISVWESVKEITLSVVDWIVEAFWTVISFFTETLPNAFMAALDWFVKNICEPIANFYDKWIAPVVNKLIEIALKLVEMIGAIFIGLWNLLKTYVIEPIVEGFTWLWESIKEVWSIVSEWFYENVIEPVANFFKGLWDGIVNIFTPVIDFFANIFSKAYEKITKIFGKLKNFFSDLWGSIKKAFSALGTVIAEAISGAVKKGINGIISLIEGAINTAISLINGAISLINLLPGVEVDKIKKLKMPRLARGGIVTRSTVANIGEAGREAVLPLENNTGWMDMLADRIASRQGAPSKIVLALDGKELGYATINSINNITRQTGTLQLAII